MIINRRGQSAKSSNVRSGVWASCLGKKYYCAVRGKGEENEWAKIELKKARIQEV